jgi:hypothetical protein
VKVKVLNIYDEPYKGTYRVPPAEQVESTLREWLKDNPRRGDTTYATTAGARLG